MMRQLPTEQPPSWPIKARLSPSSLSSWPCPRDMSWSAPSNYPSQAVAQATLQARVVCSSSDAAPSLAPSCHPSTSHPALLASLPPPLSSNLPLAMDSSLHRPKASYRSYSPGLLPTPSTLPSPQHQGEVRRGEPRVLAREGAAAARRRRGKMCEKFWISGVCSYGDRCQFLHAEDMVEERRGSRGEERRSSRVEEQSSDQQQQLATRSTLNPEAEDWTLRFGRTPRQMVAAFVPQLTRVPGRGDQREAQRPPA